MLRLPFPPLWAGQSLQPGGGTGLGAEAPQATTETSDTLGLPNLPVLKTPFCFVWFCFGGAGGSTI